MVILSLQAGILNIISSIVYLKVKQVFLKVNYRDHLMLLPSYPLYFMGSHVSTVEVEQRNFIPPRLIVVSPLNALNQIDAKNIAMLLEKFIAFSK